MFKKLSKSKENRNCCIFKKLY